GCHVSTAGVPRIINLLCDRSLMQSAQMRVNRVTPAIIDEAAASIGLKLPTPGRGKRKVASVEPTRWHAVGIAAAVLALLVAGTIWFVPLDQLIEAAVPPPPGPPPDRSRSP